MFTIAENIYPPASRKGVHEHDRPSMSLVMSGALLETIGRTAEVIRPLSISFMPAGVPHHDEFGQIGACLFTVRFDDAAGLDLAAASGAFTRWQWIHGGPGVRHFLGLLQAVREGRPAHEVEQLVIDTMIGADSTTSDYAVSTPPRWLEQVREELDSCSVRPPTRELAALGGVHRIHLARQFRRYFGCSMSDYLRRRRIQCAAHLIGSTGTRVSIVAQQTGFTDHPHLCRTFRHETGVTPSQFRSMVRRPPITRVGARPARGRVPGPGE